MDNVVSVEFRRWCRWRMFLRCYLPQMYLRLERRHILESEWLTEEEKEEKVWLLEHTVGKGGKGDQK